MKKINLIPYVVFVVVTLSLLITGVVKGHRHNTGHITVLNSNIETKQDKNTAEETTLHTN